MCVAINLADPMFTVTYLTKRSIVFFIFFFSQRLQISVGK